VENEKAAQYTDCKKLLYDGMNSNGYIGDNITVMIIPL